ncbi:MAG: hypothetical protein L0H83_02945 [Salinisphaera sp.]|nr:hypothetical protein [Salinisphaera sp.]
MPFTSSERATLLAVKGVGDTVVARLEQMGFSSLTQLAEADADDVLAQGAGITGASCWRNSGQARAAITGAIAMARSTKQLHKTDSPDSK